MYRLKVCGIKEPDNYNRLVELGPDFIGLNFFKKSSRYVEKRSGFLKNEQIELVGIFVDPSIDEVESAVKDYDLDYIQLHGNESALRCAEFNAQGYKIIKAFQVSDGFDFEKLEDYLPTCEYFLFDTAGKLHGGNGQSFNWDILKFYPYNKPYLLAGGLNPDNINGVFQLRLPQLMGIDINSGYELEPGIKDIDKINELKDKIRDDSSR